MENKLIGPGVFTNINLNLIKPLYNTPQEHLESLVKWWDSFEFEQAIPRTFREMNECERQINELLKEHPELEKVNLKNYTYYNENFHAFL